MASGQLEEVSLRPQPKSSAGRTQPECCRTLRFPTAFPDLLPQAETRCSSGRLQDEEAAHMPGITDAPAPQHEAGGGSSIAMTPT